MEDIINKLEIILEQRKAESDEKSYVASLYKKGNDHICNKILEEAQELVDASNMSNKGHDLMSKETSPAPEPAWGEKVATAL